MGAKVGKEVRLNAWSAVIGLLFLINTANAQNREQALISLARTAVRATVLHRPLPLIRDNNPPKPVFITIESKGKVLGCRGDLIAHTESLQEEVLDAAIDASRFDPRYRPLTQKDLDHLLVTVTIVESLQPLSDVRGLSPADGLVVENGDSVGVVLPLEGKDPALRLKWGYKKAGLAYGSPAKLYRLVGERFRG